MDGKPSAMDAREARSHTHMATLTLPMSLKGARRNIDEVNSRRILSVRWAYAVSDSGEISATQLSDVAISLTNRSSSP